jgi:LmbE family N-acetylglucosaminyl deacetylase
VTAHPDDEAGSFGGTLLKYAASGVATYVLCLTAGTAATHRGGAKDAAALAKMRRQEFADSCALLQVRHAECLDYPDGALASADLVAITGEIVRRIRSFQPHVVMTYGPEGAVTAHPDHSMAGTFASLAFQWAARDNRYMEQLQEGLNVWRAQKLYYATASFTMKERQPVALSPTTAVIDLTREQIDSKVAAFKRHTSQSPLFDFFDRTVHARGECERFHLAAAVTPQDLQRESDLFEGIA